MSEGQQRVYVGPDDPFAMALHTQRRGMVSEWLPVPEFKRTLLFSMHTKRHAVVKTPVDPIEHAILMVGMRHDAAN